MRTASCPSDQALREYAIGDCTDILGEEIERHLASCATCEETAAKLDSADDTLIRHLPLAAGDLSSAASEPPPWLDRLQHGLRSPAAFEQANKEAPLDVAPAEGIANYELSGVLGQGGMGVVYLARHKQLNRRVAIKVLSSRTMSSAEAQSRFLREIHLLGSLRHPGIVMATDAGTTRSGAYLVMELVDGADLSRIVREGGPLSVAQACEVARQMAEALAAAHDVGVIHRDVKPSNVMIDRQQGRIRLLDFGLARLAEPFPESDDTSVGRLLGTLDYMSPEQASGEPAVDVRADLYGLGATLFFLLIGRPPHGAHAGRPLLAHLAAITHEVPPRVRTLRADVPEALDELLACLLDSDPAQRPQSAASVAEELARWAGGDLTGRVADLRSQPDAEDQSPIAAAEARSLLSELIGPEPSTIHRDTAANSRSTVSSPPEKGLRWGWLTAVGALAAAMLFGVTLLLKTSAGTLRIESEVDDVQVEIIDDEDQSRELRIERGTNETVLRAGKYRVSLAGSHDGLSLEPGVITLSSGEKVVARITRVDDHATATAKADALPDDETGKRNGGSRPPLYKGRKESEWRRLYEAETAVVARLEAAEALLNLAAVRPAEQQVDRILEIGSEVVESNYGDASLMFAFEDTGPSPRLSYIGWRSLTGSDLFKQYESFLGQVRSQLQQLPAAVVAETLAKELLNGSDPRSAFAASLLRTAVNRTIRTDPAATRILLERLDVPLSGMDRSAISLLVRAEYVGEKLDDKQAFARDLNELVVRLNEAPPTAFRKELRMALLSVFATRDALQDLELDKRAIAKLVLNDGRDEALDQMFAPMVDSPQPWIPYVGTSYGSPTRAREDTAWFIDGWIPVVNESLEAQRHAPRDKLVRYLVRSLESVLRLYSVEDEWPVNKTAALLTEQLRAYYADGPEATTDRTVKDILPATPADLLALMVHITGEIPAFVRNGHPRPASVMRKLNQLETLLTGDKDAKQVVREFDALKGLLDDAPYEVVRLAVGDHTLPPNTRIILRGLYVPLNPTELLYVTSSLGDDRNNRRRSPTDPLLLLAILADLTGQSEAQDERIATLLAISSPEVMLRGPLENLLSGQLKARQHASKLLKRMAAKAKSQDLVDAIEYLDLTAPADPNSTPAN